MSAITEEMLGMFARLQPKEKILIEGLANKKSDEQVAAMLRSDVKTMRWMIDDVAKQLQLPKTANQYGTRQYLISLQERFVSAEQTKTLGAPKESLPQESLGMDFPSEEVDEPTADRAEGETLPQTESVVHESRAAALVSAAAAKIPQLDNKLKNTLVQLIANGPRGGATTATALGLSQPGLSLRVSRIYQILGLANEEKRHKRVLLCNAWALYKKSVLAPLPASVEPAPPVSVVTTELAKPPPAVETTMVAPEHPSVPVQWGPGTVINLSEDVLGIEIVSGVFNGKSPSAELATVVAERKKDGFMPCHLVLSTALHDPRVALAQVVLIKR